ncbi:MAG: DUF4468 domain-containing protein [Prolixibacteraceae bacterium]|nr:DUF4468 domain-containing protein [Prolixibacteraceae bacterium]
MKKLMFIVLFFPFISIAQQYTEVVKAPDKSSDQLYSTAREWFAESFKSASNVLQMDDPVAGKLIGKGSFNLVLPYNSMIGSIPINIPVSFTIKVFVKDSLYKYDIGSLFIDSNGSPHSLEEFKSASTEEGARKTLIELGGMKNPSDKMIKKTADYNAIIFRLSEVEINKTIASLKGKMSSSDNW